MNKLLKGISLGVVVVGSGFSVPEASAAITIPPSANIAHSDTNCYSTDTAGRVRHVLTPSSSCSSGVYTNVYVGAPFVENPGSSVSAFWNGTQPTGTQFCAQLRTYTTTGALFSSSSLVCGAGSNNTSVSKSNGGALLRVRFLTNNTSVAWLNHVVFN